MKFAFIDECAQAAVDWTLKQEWFLARRSS
jgi:hypothetical protein